MVEPKIENLEALAQEIAFDRQEIFSSEHVSLAMDRIIFGPCYYDGSDKPTQTGHDADTVDEKLLKLEERAKIYRAYDKFLAEKGYRGNREIDAAIIRQAVWYGHIDEIIAAAEDEDQFRMMSLSLMCKTNGMFLGREVLNRDFTFFTHGPLFDLFVQKDPYKTIAQQDPENKIRLLEMPRGSFKSVGDGIDCVQWIILKPDIRIMFLTATLQLAKDFVKEIKNYFTVDEDSEVTPFQRLFAADIRLERAKKDGQFQKLNFLIADDDTGKETEFICPARTKGDQKKKEVTIWAGSVGGGKVGKHCDVIKADDAIDEKNTDTPKLIQKTKKRIGMASKLVDPGGYKDNLGTPYAPNDWYNHIRQNVKNAMILIRPCKWLKKDLNGATAIDRGVSQKDLVDHDWTLLFPVDKHGEEKLSYGRLREVEEEDPDGFPSQFLLDPYGYKKASFPEALIYQQTITRDQMPAQLEPYTYYLLGDLADTQNQTSDYTVIVVLAVDREGRGYVVEIFRDRYTFAEISYVIAKANHDYKPVRIIIEDARGASKLRGDMERASQDLGDKNIPLDFIKVNNSKSAKSIRIGKLEPKLKDRRLFILNSVNCYQELVVEFKDFGSAPHDDIPDAIGFCEHVLEDTRKAPLDPAAAAAAQRILNAKAWDEMIHNGPEEYIDVPIEPIENTEIGGTGNDTAGDLWDPYSAVQIGRRI
jgi:predicted phage terminase large subunit-like protein